MYFLLWLSKCIDFCNSGQDIWLYNTKDQDPSLLPISNCSLFLNVAHFSWFFRIKIELHFSLIAAAVTYIMWKNVGNDKIQKMEGKKFPKEVDQIDSKKRRYWRVDCQSASKGLFLGKVCLEKATKFDKNSILLLTNKYWFSWSDIAKKITF